MHICRISASLPLQSKECGRPATRCIVVTDNEDGSRSGPIAHTETVWLCVDHWNDLGVHKFFRDFWDKVEY